MNSCAEWYATAADHDHRQVPHISILRCGSSSANPAPRDTLSLARHARRGDPQLPEITVTTPAEKTGQKTTPATPPAESRHEDHETALESLASICTVLAVGLFVMTFVFQNFEIPSASMEKTLLIGDHVLVDRI